MTGISEGSNEELREDYKDFLRLRKLDIWNRNDGKLKNLSWVSKVCRDISNGINPNIPPIPTDPDHAANLMYDLTTKAGYLLNRLAKSLKKKHETEGGLTESLYKKRISFRNKNSS